MGMIINPYRFVNAFPNLWQIDFDGIDESLISADSNLLSFTNGAGQDLPFSISVWATMDANNFPLFAKGATVSREYYFLFNSANRLLAVVSNPAGSAEIAAASTLTFAGDIGTRQNYIMTYTGNENFGSFAIYRNGVSLALTNVSGGVYTGMTNGVQGAYNGQFFNAVLYANGKMDEISLWNKAKSAAEVTETYNGGNPGNLSTHSAAGNLVEWWRHGDGDTFPNIVGKVNGISFGMTNMEAGDIVAA